MRDWDLPEPTVAARLWLGPDDDFCPHQNREEVSVLGYRAKLAELIQRIVEALLRGRVRRR